MDLEKRYLLAATVLVVIAFGASLVLYPEWQGAWWLLIAIVVINVVAFIADFRQAFEKNDEMPKAINTARDDQIQDQQLKVNIQEGYTGGDILVSIQGNVTKIGSQVENRVNKMDLPFVSASQHESSSTKSHHVTQSIVLHPGSAPPRPSLIVGRDDDIKALKERLNVGENRISFQVLTAIKGWPGVGKTTIASAIAHDIEIARCFPDGVLWTSLGQKPNILSEMGVWGRALGTEEVLKAGSVEVAQSLLAGLLRDKRMLLIIDDVWKTEDAVPFKVGGADCATLITTRFDGVACALAPVENNIYRLKVLKDVDALELLKQLAPSVVAQYPNECLVLVQELEGLPLALQVAGRLLNAEANYGFGVAELIEELRDGRKLLEATAPADRADLVTETTPTIAALLQKSLDRLDEATRDCYAYLGVFAPKPATFDIDAMKFVWQVEDPKPTIKTLVDRGLLEFVPELGRYQMHALLVMLAKSLLSEN